MPEPIFFTLTSSPALLESVAKHYQGKIANINLRHFPDGETFFKIEDDVKDRPVVIVETLDHPDDKVMPLMIAADTVKRLGAHSVGLVAPYLAYMRQDKAFSAGEAISSQTFAKLVSEHFDWMVTIDPHLHRYHDLNEIYTIPTQVLHAAPIVADWIQNNIESPMLIGPDSESEQWVSEMAKQINAPYLVLEKTRHGDKDVSIKPVPMDALAGHTPVLVDDMISTGRTLIKVIEDILPETPNQPVCVAIHAVFSGDAFEALKATQIGDIVTTNTIKHPSNRIDISTILLQNEYLSPN